MPIFDFKCKDCDITEEHLVSKYDVIVCCDKCDMEMVRQFTSKVSFDLKGSGFHKSGWASYKESK